jgi:hypothetical protein
MSRRKIHSWVTERNWDQIGVPQNRIFSVRDGRSHLSQRPINSESEGGVRKATKASGELARYVRPHPGENVPNYMGALRP